VRGPLPLAAFERTFAASYVPLLVAVARGLGDPRARAAREDFRRTFERAYTDAFPTFALTGKRPRMPFDAPELAARAARASGARATQLVMVPSLRFDVGVHLRDATLAAIGPRAEMVDEHVLYAALPSTPLRQLEGFARGIDAYRGPAASLAATEDPADDAVVVVGRAQRSAAEHLRRIKIGAREILVLETLHARVRAPTIRDPAAAASTATNEAAAVLARHARATAGKTLLFVFGAHGFADGVSGAARSGGASPEEVITPAFAFVLGDVH
jgi:hypothetical protein